MKRKTLYGKIGAVFCSIIMVFAFMPVWGQNAEAMDPQEPITYENLTTPSDFVSPGASISINMETIRKLAKEDEAVKEAFLNDELFYQWMICKNKQTGWEIAPGDCTNSSYTIPESLKRCQVKVEMFVGEPNSSIKYQSIPVNIAVPVSSVSIDNIKAPVVGEKPSKGIPIDTGFTITGESWDPFMETPYFMEKTKYAYTAGVEAADGYYFTEGLSFYIAGQKATVIQKSSDQAKISITFPETGSGKTSIHDKAMNSFGGNLIYNGKNQYPKISFDGLKKDTDFKMTGGRKDVGKGTAVIKGIGDYEGKITIGFTVLPKKVVLKKVIPGKKSLKVTYGNVGGGCMYQISYQKKGTKGWTTISTNTTTKTIKKLTAKKKYYVKVRAYKKVEGKMYYGSYSSAKQVKVK